MPVRTIKPYWKQRLAEMNVSPVEIHMPQVDGKVEQDVEWLEISHNGSRQRIRFHDYHELYAVPGLYERLFYGKLKCCSPFKVVNLLHDVMNEQGADMDELSVLDVGAGNGMVGDELHQRGVKKLIGVDIIPEAKAATYRDRPGLYKDYFVADFTDLPENDEEAIRKHRLNGLTTVAALGFGDIPDAAFIKALDLTETPAWLAFNIKDRFLEDGDDSGFAGLIRRLRREKIIRVEAYRRYRHRISITGQPLYYVAMVAKKIRDVPDHLL